MSAIVLPQLIADCASSEMSEILARPTRFELVTSAFGGQFPKFAMSCGGLLIGEKWRVYEEIRLKIFAVA